MAVNGNQFAAVFIGSMILGVWLWLAFFDMDFGTAWGLWGLAGLVMAASLYGLRLANDQLRIVLWVVLGLAVGALVTAMVQFEEPLIMGTLVTLVGGGLIAASIPTPEQIAQARHGTWVVEDEPAGEGNGA